MDKEILEKLEKLWEIHPNQRFGQLLENYIFNDGERGDETSRALFYQSDEKTLWNIKESLGENNDN
jgi:hypothetical protein